MSAWPAAREEPLARAYVEAGLASAARLFADEVGEPVGKNDGVPPEADLSPRPRTSTSSTVIWTIRVSGLAQERDELAGHAYLDGDGQRCPPRAGRRQPFTGCSRPVPRVAACHAVLLQGECTFWDDGHERGIR